MQHRIEGGYLNAYVCGVNMAAAVVRNLSGEENEVRIGEYKEGICMMKFNEVMIRDMAGEEIVP